MKWYGLYKDDTIITENSEFTIERDKLKQFGLEVELVDDTINKIFYNVENGKFNLLTDNLSFELHENNKMYELNASSFNYTDCICYHNFYQDLNGNDNSCKLRGYSFGYKTKCQFTDLSINFQPILEMNYGSNLIFQIRLVSDRYFKGDIIVKNNGITINRLNIELNSNVSEKYQIEI